MFLSYVFLLFLSLCITNVYIVWFLMEMMLLFFFLTVLKQEIKNVGLVIYFFFQSVMSLMLFVVLFFGMSKYILLFLMAKLGLFPFFYWVVVVSVKVSFLANMFVLSLQKVTIFWLVWLVLDCSVSVLYLLVYSSIFFVVINLLMISDLWLLIVYSSIANTGMILVSILGSQYMFIVFLYLFVILGIIFFAEKLGSYSEMMFMIFFFLVVPPFVLFFMKFYMILSLDYVMKLGFFLAIFDVFVLLYYFSLVFMKFMLMEFSVMIYMMNLLILLFVMIFSNCVTMIVFY